MEIVKDQIDELNAVVKINIAEGDYREKVDGILRNYRKQVKMPGFRVGHVPFGMVKKMYEPKVLAEELNKIINENLYKYISENKLEVLGNPLPNETQTKVDFAKNTEFEFAYDLGLSPKFDVQATDKDKFNLYDVKIDDKLLDKNVNDIAKRYGKVSKVEESAGNDMLQGEFVELDDKEAKEGGIIHTSTIALEFLEDDKVKKTLVGKKVGDKVIVEPSKVSKGEKDTAAMLGITTEQADKLKSKFSFEIKEIYRVEPAELNKELFDKTFGPDNVNSIEEFRAKIADSMKKMMENDTKRKLYIDVSDHFIDKLKLKLPDTFLKRWLVESNEQNLNADQVEKDYEQYAKGLKWQLIQNKLLEKHDIKIETQDIIEKSKQLIKDQMAQYGMLDVPEEQLMQTVKKILENREEVNKISQMIQEEKLIDLFQTSFKLKNKEVSYDEFVKLASTKQPKGLFDSIKNNLNL